MVINKRLFLSFFLFFFLLEICFFRADKILLMSQSDVRLSVLIVKVFCSGFNTVWLGFFNEIK